LFPWISVDFVFVLNLPSYSPPEERIDGHPFTITTATITITTITIATITIATATITTAIPHPLHSLKHRQMARALTIEDDLPLSLFGVTDLNNAADCESVVSLEPELFRLFLGRFPSQDILRSTILELAMESVSCRKPEVLKIIIETFPEAKIDPLETRGRYSEMNILYTAIAYDSLECFKYLIETLEKANEHKPEIPLERSLKFIVAESYKRGHRNRSMKIMIYLLKNYKQFVLGPSSGVALIHDVHSYLTRYIALGYPITLIRAFIENMPVDIHKNNDELLLLSVKHGEFALADYFIQLGISPSENPEILETAFRSVNYECYENDYRMVALLLNHGATLDDVSDEYRRRFDEWAGEEAGVRRALLF